MEYEGEKIKNSLLQLINLDVTDPKIVNYILSKCNYIPYLNFSQFMKDLNINEEEATRFLKDNGYNYFTEFQSNVSKCIFNLINSNDVSYLSHAESFNKSDIIDILRTNVEVELDNMNNMLSTLDYDKFAKLIDDIINSPEVIIIGTRASITLAQYASYMLNKVGIKVNKITSADTSSFDNIQNFDRSSLVISFGFPRYPKETIKLLNYFNRKNFKIISITDSEKSPLCNFSSYSIIVKAYSIEYTDSFINGIILINTIAIALGKIDNKKVVKRLNEFEETAKNLEYYF
jgi:DNA-binding MurR/RpiR family transcriptional regulator